MSLTVLFISTAILYVFSILNSLWFKIKVAQGVLKALKTIHLFLIPFFVLPLISFLLGEPLYFKGHCTNYILFWCFLLTGFLLVSFGSPIKNVVLKTYLFILQYIWLVLLTLFFIVPLVGIILSYPILHFALPPGNVVFSNEQLRIEEQNENLNFISRRYMKRYYLVSKKGVLNHKAPFSLSVKTDSIPQYSSIEIDSKNDSFVYVTFTCNEAIIFDKNDSLQNSITKKIALK